MNKTRSALNASHLFTDEIRIRFVLPPKSQHIAGIKLAVDGLFESLQQRGIAVHQGGDITDTAALHHFHGLWQPSHSWLATRLRRLGRPYVVSPHGMLEPWALRHRSWKKQPYFKLIERQYLESSQALFVTSDMEAKHLVTMISHPQVENLRIGCQDRHRPDYMAARTALNWKKDERILLFLSRIDVKKGLDMLIQAIAISQFKEKWRLVIVGDGDPAYVESLKSTVASLGNNMPIIEWIGPVWGKARWVYLQGADLFCLPTHSENFGLAVLEALHVGTPVLTTEQTPWVEYRDKEGFFIAKPEVSSIHETLSAAFASFQLGWSSVDRESLADWTDKKFSWPSIIDSYINAYEQLIRK
ncbi:glycosyltransferase [Methylovulum psychrotolerans]|uniref:Glycosyl transferase family 1 n=1 Tax=Methylovulum psychrotolerans TaxID=1704499 RepID=A0A2S5CMQ9_9GAMM|nr:glycosyltransferase [Methylovulum psychrotolerans]POZ52109.1 glycosyl transferase family 1 [Methylovulum psychrotolerans]